VTIPALALALAIGVGMGLLGGGGSVITVPALTFLLHFPPKDAVVTSLAIVGVAAAAGTVGGLVRGALPLTVAAIVGLSATAGAYAGGAAGARIPEYTQLVMLASLMFVAAVALWRVPTPTPADDGRRGTPVLMLTLLGVAIGFVTGLVGVGGGFLIVPALVIWARLPLPQATTASLLVITLAAFAAIPGYLGRVTLDWSFIAPFAGTAAAGAVAGGALAPYLPQRRLQQVFAAALVILGSYVLIRA
jgi:uncharacterized membrane protein YfcA